jgi:hypothetical protein
VGFLKRETKRSDRLTGGGGAGRPGAQRSGGEETHEGAAQGERKSARFWLEGKWGSKTSLSCATKTEITLWSRSASATTAGGGDSENGDGEKSPPSARVDYDPGWCGWLKQCKSSGTCCLKNCRNGLFGSLASLCEPYAK